MSRISLQTLLAEFHDEELVVLAQEAESIPARNELLARHLHEISGLIRLLALRRGVRSPHDQDDLCQNATLAMIEAIRHYDTLQMALSAGCSFRTFLHQVVEHRFKDQLKSRTRLQRREYALAAQAWGGRCHEQRTRIRRAGRFVGNRTRPALRFSEH